MGGGVRRKSLHLADHLRSPVQRTISQTGHLKPQHKTKTAQCNLPFGCVSDTGAANQCPTLSEAMVHRLKGLRTRLAGTQVVPRVIPFSDREALRCEAADSADARQGEATTDPIDRVLE